MGNISKTSYTIKSMSTPHGFIWSSNKFCLENILNSKANDFLVLIRRFCYLLAKSDSKDILYTNEIKTKEFLNLAFFEIQMRNYGNYGSFEKHKGIMELIYVSITNNKMKS